MAAGDSAPLRKRSGDREIIIRASEPEDRYRTREIQWSAGWKEPPSYHRRLPEADSDWLGRHYYKEIVAQADGVIAARVGLEAYRQPFAELIDLSVRPDYRRQGLGESLTLACEREAALRGFSALFLQTELDNHAAHALYRDLGFIPTVHGKMLRMVKFIDYPLISDFCKRHPLHEFSSCPGAINADEFKLNWKDPLQSDSLSLTLQGAASRTESGGIGPAVSACEWSLKSQGRGLTLTLSHEKTMDLEPGQHVELQISVVNTGAKREHGVFQLALPPGLLNAGNDRTLLWEASPGETVTQSVVIEVEPGFEDSVLYELNYHSVPVSVETYWEGHRALLNVSLPFATPQPIS